MTVTTNPPDAWIALPEPEEMFERLNRAGALIREGASDDDAHLDPMMQGYRPLNVELGRGEGPPRGMGALLLSHHRIGPIIQALFGEIMFGPGELTRMEREMLAAVASAAQDCFY